MESIGGNQSSCSENKTMSGAVSEITLRNRANSDQILIAGVFGARDPEMAQKFSKALSQALRILTDGPVENRLKTALGQCQPSHEEIEGLHACVLLLEKSEAAYLLIGQGFVCHSIGDGIAFMTPPSDQKSSDSEKAGNQENRKATMSEAAFGSLIDVDRESLPQQNPNHVQTGSSALHPTTSKLILGAGVSSQTCTPDFFLRLRKHQETCSSSDEKHVSTTKLIVMHLAQNAQKDCYSTILDELPNHTEQDFAVQTPERRVQFVQPIENETSPFGNLSELQFGRLSFQNGNLGRRSHNELMSNLRGGYDEPSMTIPEDGQLPRESEAGQLPPPLLAPIRKAYPSGEWTITPEMLASPSPARKGMIGRAASFNSPEGLWMPESFQNLPSLSSLPFQSLGSSSMSYLSSPSRTNGPCTRGGNEDGRVRGGLPRPSSSSHLSAYNLGSPSPEGSPHQSPRQSGVFSISANSQSLNSQQDSDSQENLQAVWNVPISPAGKKIRGRSTALKMLKSAEIPAPERKSQNFPYSAPAALLSETRDNSDPKLEESLEGGSFPRGTRSLDSSQTDQGSVDQDFLSRTTSVTSSGGSRTVLCLPPLHEIPQGERVKLVSFDAMRNPSVENPFKTNQTLSQSLEEISERRQRGNGRQRIWIQSPDDAAAEMRKRSERCKLEERQHSGMAFSKSSPDIRLADSVRSLTMAES